MDEENFNIQLRKFLKNVGITSQREIETSVRDSLKSGNLNINDTLNTKVVLTVPELNLQTEITGKIDIT